MFFFHLNIMGLKPCKTSPILIAFKKVLGTVIWYEIYSLVREANLPDFSDKECLFLGRKKDCCILFLDTSRFFD